MPAFSTTNSHNTETQLVTQLFEQYHLPIFNYIRGMTHDDAWANDLTQDTFLQLFKKRQQLPTIENQRAWVYRIATNITYNALKRRKRWQWLPWQDGGHLTTADHAPASAEQMVVQATLAQLDPKYRDPLVLYSQFDLSIREVAQALNLSESNVKVRLHRAREQFRQLYPQNGE
jgi:RNA polymerase sigma-70 factor (ECF subfamily)